MSASVFHACTDAGRRQRRPAALHWCGYPAATKECHDLDGFDPHHARQHDPRRTRTNILAAGQAVFAEHGYSGAKVSEIVARAGTTKPMIYYHFGNKEGLFAAVLEEVYAGMRGFECSVPVAGVPPLEAMRRLVQVTFDYHAAHPEWIRLISVANIHGAQHIAGSDTIASKNSAVLVILRDLLARGAADGVFRTGVDPLHLHLLIASFSFYRVSNRHTWRVIFQRDLAAPDDAAQQRDVLVGAVLHYLAPNAGAGAEGGVEAHAGLDAGAGAGVADAA